MLESSFSPSDKELDSFISCFPRPSPSFQRGSGSDVQVMAELGRVLVGCEYFGKPWGWGSAQGVSFLASGALLCKRGFRQASPNYSFSGQHCGRAEQSESHTWV